MRRILLKKITQEKVSDGVRAFFHLDIDDKDVDLEYCFHSADCQIDKISDRFDAIAVLFVHQAVEYGYNLESVCPLSEELYYTLTRHVIPHLYAANKEYATEITIKAPLIKESYHGAWNGTGVSCGVDSMSAIYEYTQQIELDEYKLTHLVYLKVGQHAETIGRYDKELELSHFLEGLANAKAFAKDVNLPLIIGESNFNEVVCSAFGYSSLVPTFTYRNLGSMLMLQNYFSKYFYASSYGDINHFKVDLKGDVAYYERWLLPLISTDSIHFYSASKSLERFEKTAMLTEYTPSYKHLSVCWRGGKNCGYCSKCIRTMVTLDLLGALDKYAEVFDMELFQARRSDLYVRVYQKRKQDPFYEEIAQYMEKHKIKKPGLNKMMHFYVKKLNNHSYPQVPFSKE